MIITDDFVFIVYPKTASAFTREAFDEIHNKPSYVKWFNKLFKGFYYPSNYQRIKVNKLEVHNRKGQPTEHGLYIQVKQEDREKRIFSICRSPFDRLVSLYTFRDWLRTDELLIDPYTKNKFPNYPELSFDQYLDALYKVNPLIRDDKFDLKQDIGPLTIQFILFYFNDPYEVLNKKLSDEYIFKNRFLEDMPEIYFAKMSNLAEDVISFLKAIGYSEEQVKFVREKKQTNKSRPATKSKDDYFSKETLDFVKHKERYLLHFCKILNLDL
jgi:predicted house-cleaning noncanonical NTP pyrophosphatase (MazG superfamily)